MLSPVKNGKYFDLQIQTKEKIMRGVCFSRPKVKRFTEFSESATPVKLKKLKEFIEDVILKLPAAVIVTYQKRDKIITSITIE